MEAQILELIRTEVRRQVQIQTAAILERVSTLYEIPLECLVNDTIGLDMSGCRGTLANGSRCLKKPHENGFCKFHTPGPTCKGVGKNGAPCGRRALNGFCPLHVTQNLWET